MKNPEKTFDRVYALCFSRVYAYFSSGFGGQTAEDLAQQVFLKLWHALCREDFSEPESWQAWIFRVAVNEKNDFLRQKQRQGEHCGYDDSLQNETVDGEEESLLSMAVRRAFFGLEEEEQELLRLKNSGLSSREIGLLLNIPDSTVRGRLQTAKKKFRRNLRENGVESYV